MAFKPDFSKLFFWFRNLEIPEQENGKLSADNFLLFPSISIKLSDENNEPVDAQIGFKDAARESADRTNIRSVPLLQRTVPAQHPLCVRLNAAMFRHQTSCRHGLSRKQDPRAAGSKIACPSPAPRQCFPPAAPKLCSSARRTAHITRANIYKGIAIVAARHVIGTGATAVQCVPHLGSSAQELFVFQRTPSSIDVRNWRNSAWSR